MMARNLRPLGCVLLGLVVVSCCGSGRSGPIVSPAPPPAAMSGDPAVQQALQGTWELVGFETSPEPGQSVTREAQGQLTYDAFANLSVRAALVPGAPGVDPSRNVFLDFVSKASPATSGELAYVGLRNRAVAEETVPNATAPAAWRHYSLEGDTLLLYVEDAAGRRVGTLTFRRAR